MFRGRCKASAVEMLGCTRSAIKLSRDLWCVCCLRIEGPRKIQFQEERVRASRKDKICENEYEDQVDHACACDDERDEDTESHDLRESCGWSPPVAIKGRRAANAGPQIGHRWDGLYNKTMVACTVMHRPEQTHRGWKNHASNSQQAQSSGPLLSDCAAVS